LGRFCPGMGAVLSTSSNSQTLNRHCEEPTGRANARPMTGSATKQSISRRKERMDCFASLAMTARHKPAFPRRDAPGVCQKFPPKTEGAGNAGCALHPRSRAQKEVGVHARAYRLSGGARHPLRNGFTAYAVLSPATNSSCHRRRRICGYSTPVGLELATAGLAPATGVRTTRFCRTLQRRSSCAHAHRSRGSTRPATTIRADALASITSRPAFVTTRDRPSCRNGMAMDID
jgi:hypothetical protein